MGYLVHILLALTAHTLAETGLATSWRLPVAVLALCAVPYWVAAGARRARSAGRARLCLALVSALSWTPPILHWAAVSLFGWLGTVESVTGSRASLLGWPHPSLFIALGPFFVYGLLSIDARARVTDGSLRELQQLKRFQLRMFLSGLTPIGLFLLVTSVVGFFPFVRLNIEEVALFGAAFAALMVASLVLILPWILRNTWETVSLGAGRDRDMLESVAAQAEFRCRDLLIWKTGHLFANAAIVGVTARHRYVMFSDSLLARLTSRELAAVFAHEIGHAKRHHVVIFAAWSLSLFLTADLIVAWTEPESDWVIGATLAGFLVVWYGAFGFLSRRFELEADLESLRLTGDVDALVTALEEVGGTHAVRKSSWRHFSTLDRVEFLRKASADPAAANQLRYRLARWAYVGVAACFVTLVAEGYTLLESWNRDQLLVDLRLGRYERAGERLSNETDASDELATLVGVATDLEDRSGDVTGEVLDVAARAALTRGDADLASAYVELAALRGTGGSEARQESIRLAVDGETDAALEGVGVDDPGWRNALESWITASKTGP